MAHAGLIRNSIENYETPPRLNHFHERLVAAYERLQNFFLKFPLSKVFCLSGRWKRENDVDFSRKQTILKIQPDEL